MPGTEHDAADSTTKDAAEASAGDDTAATRDDANASDDTGDVTDDAAHANHDAAEPAAEPAAAPRGAASSPWSKLVVVLAGTALGVAGGLVVLTRDSNDQRPVSTAPDIRVENRSSGGADAESANGGPAAVGAIAPRLVGTSLDGSPITVAPGDGTPQMLVFLAHWCPVCQGEVGEIVQLAQRGELDGVNVTAVVTAIAPERANYPPGEWLDGLGWRFATFTDNDDGVAAEAYGVVAIPTVVLIAPDARVVARLNGLGSGDAERVLQDFVAGRYPTPSPAPAAPGGR